MQRMPDNSKDAPLSISLSKSSYVTKEGEYTSIPVHIENHSNRTLGMVVAIVFAS